VAWKANRRNYNLLIRDQQPLLLIYLFRLHRPLY
jgi:hypothetical protein